MAGALAAAASLLTVTVYAPAASAAEQPEACESSPPVGTQHDRLKVKVKPQPAPQIIDPASRKPIILRGYNWGEWDTVQPQDNAENVAQGANSVRIPLRWWGDYKYGVDSFDDEAPGFIEPCHLKLLDDMIRQAVEKQLWVTLFVDSDNGQGSGLDPNDNFWTDTTKKGQFQRMWQFLAARYQNTPYIGALEILPEPNLNTGGKKDPTVEDDLNVKSFYDDMIKVIRGVDTKTPLVVGPNDLYNIKRLDHAVTTADDNIIYTGDYFIHDEAPLDRTQLLTDFQGDYHVPAWINQVGIPSGDPTDPKNTAKAEAIQVLDDLNNRGIGWSWWTYRVRATSATTHGIYYVDPNHTDPNDPKHWVIKMDWYDLVGDRLPQRQH